MLLQFYRAIGILDKNITFNWSFCTTAQGFFSFFTACALSVLNKHKLPEWTNQILF